MSISLPFLLLMTQGKGWGLRSTVSKARQAWLALTLRDSHVTSRAKGPDTGVPPGWGEGWNRALSPRAATCPAARPQKRRRKEALLRKRLLWDVQKYSVTFPQPNFSVQKALCLCFAQAVRSRRIYFPFWRGDVWKH